MATLFPGLVHVASNAKSEDNLLLCFADSNRGPTVNRLEWDARNSSAESLRVVLPDSAVVNF